MALGVLATMTHADSGAVMRVAPVEYNQLQPLLKATGGKYAQGDTNGADGYSPFPGNTNAIFAALPMYVAVLTRTGGMVPEFVNPKYKAGDGAGFQSPTRLECMMQDYARLLDEDAAVGFTSHPIEYGYFPCKNNLADAQALSAKGVPSYGAASSEMAVYAAHAAALRRLGAAVPVGVERSFHGVTVTQGPAVVFAPSFAPTMSELRRRFPTASAVRLTARSTLLVDGEDVTIDALELDGALEVRVCDGASLRIISLAVVNDGWSFDELSEAVLANAECPPLPESALQSGVNAAAAPATPPPTEKLPPGTPFAVRLLNQRKNSRTSTASNESSAADSGPRPVAREAEEYRLWCCCLIRGTLRSVRARGGIVGSGGNAGPRVTLCVSLWLLLLRFRRCCVGGGLAWWRRERVG